MHDTQKTERVPVLKPRDAIINAFNRYLPSTDAPASTLTEIDNYLALWREKTIDDLAPVPLVFLRRGADALNNTIKNQTLPDDPESEEVVQIRELGCKSENIVQMIGERMEEIDRELRQETNSIEHLATTWGTYQASEVKPATNVFASVEEFLEKLESHRPLFDGVDSLINRVHAARKLMK